MKKCWRWRASSRPSFMQILNNLENIVNTVKSQKQAPAVLAVEDLDKEVSGASTTFQFRTTRYTLL